MTINVSVIVSPPAMTCQRRVAEEAILDEILFDGRALFIQLLPPGQLNK